MKSTNLSLPAARIALGSAGLTVVLLALLHVLSPELDPSWRMVSEYANGDYPWVLSLLFFAWGLSSLALTYALRSQVATRGGKFGIWLLGITGALQMLAGIFDVNHPLHDLIGNLAIPGFALAAILMSSSLGKNGAWASAKKMLMRLAHLAWISVVLLVVSFVVLMATYIQSGGNLNAGTEITTLPDGVIAFVGWTNRLLVVAFAAWTATAAWQAIKLRGRKAYSMQS